MTKQLASTTLLITQLPTIKIKPLNNTQTYEKQNNINIQFKSLQSDCMR